MSMGWSSLLALSPWVVYHWGTPSSIALKGVSHVTVIKRLPTGCSIEVMMRLPRNPIFCCQAPYTMLSGI